VNRVPAPPVLPTLPAAVMLPSDISCFFVFHRTALLPQIT